MAQRITLGKQQGFGYLTVLALALALGVALGATTERLDTKVKREKEQALLFIGEQYRHAISEYYELAPQDKKEFPKTLEALVLDKRVVETTRHLRRYYPDPITGGEWGLIRNKDKRITGVYSLSQGEILQTAKFQKKRFIGEGSIVMPQIYSDIKFNFIKREEKKKTPKTSVEKE